MPTPLPPGRYHGQLLRRRDVAGLVLAEVGYEPGDRVPRHGREAAHVCLVRQGRCTEALGRRSWAGGPGAVVYHPAGEVYALRFDDAPARLFHVELGPGWAARARGECAGLPAGGLEVRGGTAAALALRLYQEFHRTDAAAPLVVEGLALELVGELARAARPPRRARPAPAGVARAWDLLEKRFAEGLKVEGLAKAVGVHPVHLSGAFRRAYGCTIGERVRQLRVACAAAQLAQTDRPLEAVARRAGFCSLSHLSAGFKKQTGLTPSAFRRLLRPRGRGR
jgi:AraC family transcriptional regulator